MREKNRIQRMRTPLDTALLMACWILANRDTFRSCGSQFGVHSSVIYCHYSYIIKALREIAPKYIKWPSEAERDVIKVQFEQRYGYPGVIGCIDGTHIQITAPLEQPQRYVNRHHNYSISAEAVCDHRLLYRDIYIGQPGSVGDARMFARSPLSDNLLRTPELISGDEHILRDGAYTLTNHVIDNTDDHHLDRRQRNHNFCLTRARASVERSFALFEGKLRRLKVFQNYNIEVAMDHIMASFVIHNFVILNGNEPEGFCGNGEHVGVHLDGPQEELIAEAQNAGAMTREYIALLLYQRQNEGE